MDLTSSGGFTFEPNVNCKSHDLQWIHEQIVASTQDKHSKTA